MCYKLLGFVAILVASFAVLFSLSVQNRLAPIVEKCLEQVENLQKHFRLPVPNNGPEITLLLVGAAGNGRSALGNHIVGRSAFDSRFSPTMVTRDNKAIRTEVGPRKLLVVDTPGLLGHQDIIETKDVVQSLKSSFSLSRTGYSAFLVVVNQANRVTQEQIDAIKILEIVFGEDFFKHAIFVFTHTDQFEQSFNAYHNVAEAFRSYIDNQPDDMADFIHRADDRVMFVNSLETSTVVNRDFQINLIHMVDDMTRGRRYTRAHFDYAQELLKEESERKLRIEDMQRQEREQVIWDEAVATCRCPTSGSGYKLNLNIKFPGSDYVMKAIDYLVGAIQKFIGWMKTPRMLN